MLRLALALTFALPALASWHTADSPSSPWTRSNAVKEGIFTTLVFVDWKQTREFTTNRMHAQGFHEVNPILGKHPSRSKVNAVCIGSALGHYTVSRMLPDPWRDRWQNVTIGLEGIAVANNYRIGVRIKF